MTNLFFNTMPFGIIVDDHEFGYNPWYNKSTLPEIRDRLTGIYGWDDDVTTIVFLDMSRQKEWLKWGGVGKSLNFYFIKPVKWNTGKRLMECVIKETFIPEEYLDWNRMVKFKTVGDMVNDVYHREIHRLTVKGLSYDRARDIADEKCRNSNPDKLLSEMSLVKMADIRRKRYILD